MRSWLALALFVTMAVCVTAATVTLSWQDNANNEDKFRVYRALGVEGAFLSLAEVDEDVESYVDNSAVAGTTYRYRVTALNTAGESAPSNIATVSLPQAPQLPASPGGVEAVIPGNVVNVSVRAPVTATGVPIIPGFVVSDGPVRVLVRVVGPRLADLGVSDPVADPRFELIDQQTGQPVAANDNWSGADVAAAAASVSAFSLPVGSKDAALIVTLPPGQYTVLARATGADGTGLAEVWKLP